MTLLITENKKHTCNVALINVLSKVVIRKVFISIVVVSNLEVWGRVFNFKLGCFVVMHVLNGLHAQGASRVKNSTLDRVKMFAGATHSSSFCRVDRDKDKRTYKAWQLLKRAL